MKILAALLLATALVVTPYTVEFSFAAPRFPFATYQAVGPVSGPARQVCGGDAVYVTINEEWRVFSSKTKDVFIHFTDGEPDFVYFAVGQAGGVITVTRSLPYEEARRLYPDPCAYLSEASA